MEVAVVILNWNGEKLLQQFIPNVIKHSKHLANIYVVDNASTDNSLAFLKQNYPEVKTIAFDKNFGFAKGYNLAVKQLKEPYLILLNSDVEVTKHWLKPLITMLKKDTVAACQPKILDFKNKTYFEYAGASGGFIDKYGYPFCSGRIFDEIEKDEGQYNDEAEIFWASGACLAIKKEAFESVNGFDETFFAHMEEIDLCWRLKNLGYQIFAVPDSVVYHVGGASLDVSNPFKTYLNFRNNLLMLYKNLKNNRFLTLIIRLKLDGLAGIKFLFEGNFNHLLAIIKAHFSFYFSFYKYPKSNTAKFNAKGLYNRSIVYDFYIKKIKHFNRLKF